MVTIGIDTHKATLAVSAIDEAGRECGAETFPNDGEGHARLLRWARRHGPERRFGIEGSGSFGAALARLLVAADERVVEVPAVLTDRERRHLSRPARAIQATPWRSPGWPSGSRDSGRPGWRGSRRT